MARVAIIERRLTQYRVPLLVRMREELASAGITLRVLHGPTPAAEADRADEGELPGAEILPTRYVAAGRLVLQPFAARVADCRLVIVSHENRLLHNHLALVDRRRPWSLAFFGHGRNLQSVRPDGLRERFKRATALRADWWFAYTSLSAQIVADAGFPADRITVVDNSIDTATLRRAIDDERQSPLADTRAALGVPGHGPLVLSLGSLHAGRGVERLLAVAQAVRRVRPDVHLVVAGDGPQRQQLQQALMRPDVAAGVTWIGAVNGQRKAQALACAELMINAGQIGLNVLDGFAAGLPLVATRQPHHGPEAVYLRHEVNGLQVDDTVDALSDAVLRLLGDESLRLRLGRQASADGLGHGIENTADRFVAGIQDSLAAGRR